MSRYKILKDSMGEVKVPQNALYAAQTQRALDNFPISSLTMPRRFIQSLGIIKFCAAEVNQSLNKLNPAIASVIKKSANQIAKGEFDRHFPIDVFQTGSGTSSNMNANEVIATLANAGQSSIKVHPNDHVNMSQSSNDVIPTAIKVSAVLAISQELMPALNSLIRSIDEKGNELKCCVKTGRTHLMDAMPITMGQELGGWSSQLNDASMAIKDTLARLSALPQGATAVGTGVNSDKKFGKLFAQSISKKCGIKFISMKNYFAGLGSQDAAVEMSGQLKYLAVVIMKISNDLRWMNSGPLAGLGEIELPALQPGSSIMPGKVNPVIPESTAMAAAHVIGNDTAIAIGGQSGNFQLNVMLPMIAYNLLQSIQLLTNSCSNLNNKAIKGFKVREYNLQNALEKNPILITALNQIIGYEQGAMIAKTAYKENRPVLEVAKEMTELSEQELKKYLNPLLLTKQ